MVKIIGLEKVMQSIKAKLDFSDPFVINELGEETVRLIKGFTRSGESIAKTPEPVPLKPLSEGYKRFRRKVAAGLKEIKPDPDFFTPEFSNLTLTGQMLNSINFIQGPPNESSFTVKPFGTRNDGLTNEEVARRVSDNGREFIGLHDKGVEQLRQIILRNLRRRLK